MTEQEARELLDEIRTERPAKRIGRTRFVLRADGKLDVYTLNKKLTRAFYMHVSDPRVDWTHPDVRAWWESRQPKA